MRKATIGPDGRVFLGPEARAVGYDIGVVVDVVVLSSGSLLVRVADDQPIDVNWKPLEGGAAQLAMRLARREASGV